ncbi:response regulator transcription factor [Georgenia halophila]|uniref:Response regulator transcription factor n=1 Tax=Georgenia halophila TaxID=620889 RepID=A0ABP8L4H9_9MICO
MNEDENGVRVVLADDHAAVRAGLGAVLAADPGISVVGEAADGRAAVIQARALRPDVVLMDLRMPGVSGVEATAEIVGAGLATVLVLTTFDIEEYVDGALEAGAAGYLLKTVEPADLVSAVRRVAAGDGVLAPEVTRRVLQRFRERRAAPPPVPPAALEELTAREREVLAGLGHGLSNAQLADQLGISEATAKTHVSRVLTKLDLPTRMRAAVVARDAGL